MIQRSASLLSKSLKYSRPKVFSLYSQIPTRSISLFTSKKRVWLRFAASHWRVEIDSRIRSIICSDWARPLCGWVGLKQLFPNRCYQENGWSRSCWNLRRRRVRRDWSRKTLSFIGVWSFIARMCNYFCLSFNSQHVFLDDRYVWKWRTASKVAS